MFVVLLRFSTNRDRASEFMAAHNAWLERGFREGVFLLSGSLEPGGGAVIAHDTSLSGLQTRVAEDPFVTNDVVSADILEVTPGTADERLSFLIG